MKLRATKTDGRLVFADPAAYTALVGHYRDGTEFDVTVERHREGMSTAQRGYYFANLTAFCRQEWGSGAASEVEELHRALSARFLTTDRDGVPRVRSITALNTQEMADYTDQCARLLAEATGWLWQEPNSKEAE